MLTADANATKLLKSIEISETADLQLLRLASVVKTDKVGFLPS